MERMFARINSRDAWYMGHGTPAELESAAIQQQVELTWAERIEARVLVDRREAASDIRLYLDSNPDRVASLGTNGAAPIPEPHSVPYLDSLIRQVEELI